ncbi:unnamed protein product [Spodoptera exigua]|nr:unnamed protein product [Spodoptera exigua]
MATEVYPEKLETTLGNNKYFKNLKFTFRKSSRNSPYYINFDFYSTCGYGNNVSVKWVLFEYISGRYVQVPVQFEYKLCDFFYKDPFLGQMYAKQLPPNWTCPFPAATEVYPEKLETTLGNNKYFKNLKFTFRKSSRNSPYYINFDFYSTCGYGNNVSVKWVLFEYISGRYVQVPVQFEYKLCDFFYKDPFLGQMYAKQLPPNWTCPFPACIFLFSVGIWPLSRLLVSDDAMEHAYHLKQPIPSGLEDIQAYSPLGTTDCYKEFLFLVVLIIKLEANGIYYNDILV